MPNQPPSDSARQRPATPVFNPHGSGRSPHNTKKRNEPNPPRLTIKNAKRTQSQPRPQSNCAKRTQFTSTPVRPTTSLCKTNPISARPKYEPNPIYTAADLWKTKIRNEPNLHRSRPVEDQKNETNPICPPRSHKSLHSKELRAKERRAVDKYLYNNNLEPRSREFTTPKGVIFDRSLRL